jgi:hypothetical protein
LDINEIASRYVNILNTHSRRAGNVQSSSLRIGWGSIAPYSKGNTILRIDSRALGIGRALSIGLYVWEDDAEESLKKTAQ